MQVIELDRGIHRCLRSRDPKFILCFLGDPNGNHYSIKSSFNVMVTTAILN